MGKAALILVVVISMASGLHYMNSNRQAYEAEMTEAVYQQGLLAREAAESGFNIVSSRVRNDFENYRVTETGVSQGEGAYDVAVTGASGSEVTLTVTGYNGDAEYTITGTMNRETGHRLDALIVDGPLNKLEMKDRMKISGLDTKPDGSDGSDVDVHPIRAVLAEAYTTVTGKLPPSGGTVVGVNGSNYAVSGSSTFDLPALVTAIKAYSGPRLTQYTSDTKLEEVTLGSAANPVVVRVNGKLELKKTFRGYGVLFVTGEFKMEDTARWDGLVIVAESKGKFEMKKNAAIYGVYVVSATSEDGLGGDTGGGGGLPGGHFDVDVFQSGSKIYHEHQYDDDFDRTDVNLLEDKANCKTNGALCWNQVLSGNTWGWVSFKNAVNSSGTYQIKNSSVNLTGNPASGLASTRINLSTIQQFWVNFDALCMLIESSPGSVQSDNSNRNGAFTIQIHKDNSGSKGALLYELSVYHHYKEDYPCAGPPGTESTTAYGNPIEVKFEDDAKVQYSYQAFKAATDVLGYDLGNSEVVLTSASSTGIRPRRVVGAVGQQ